MFSPDKKEASLCNHKFTLTVVIEKLQLMSNNIFDDTQSIVESIIDWENGNREMK